MRKSALAALAALVAVAVVGGAIAAATPGRQTGPSSSQSPYLVPSQPGVVTRSVLTVGDSVNTKPNSTAPYRMVGIPDGLGAFDNGDGTFTLLMNHELQSSNPPVGVNRAHGAKGAFVSKWTIKKGNLQVLHGEDLIQQVVTWNPTTTPPSYNAPASGASGVLIGRLCSADLPARSAFYNSATGKGFDGRIFMNGEEIGNDGRAFAHLLDGTSYELPYLGKFSWENSVASPSTGDRTVVVGLDDSTPGQVYVYVGSKQSEGSPIVRAGLSGGKLYGVKVPDVSTESGPVNSTFSLEAVGPAGPSEGYVQNLTGRQLQDASVTDGITEFLRPEDGAWDPDRPTDFYFATTNNFTSPSRLYRLRFTDIGNPTAGGTITAVLDGTEGQKMLDNLTVDDGRVLLQEDPGNQPYVARIWAYTIATDTLTEIAEHDPARFEPGVASPLLTQDEESSGIIPAPFLGNGKYLLDVQAHYRTDDELVEGGQLLQLHIPPGKFK